LIWKFFGDQENEITDDLVTATLPETYLQFIHHYMSIIVEPLRLLQSNSITSIEVHSIMVQLKSKLQTRLNEAFLGGSSTSRTAKS
jgi:hypothetical protein